MENNYRNLAIKSLNCVNKRYEDIKNQAIQYDDVVTSKEIHKEYNHIIAHCLIMKLSKAQMVYYQINLWSL
jgi:hypothetical protein